MKSLLIYLKDYKKESFFAPLFKLLEALFELMVPLVVASIIDNGILKNDNHKIIVYGSLLIFIAIIGMVAAIVAQYFAAKVATGFGKKVRSDLFKKIQSLSFSEMDEVGTSRLVTIMTNDTSQVQNGVNMALRLFLRSPFIVFGTMIMAFTNDFKCALIFVITVIILLLIVFGIMKYTIPRYRNIQNQLDIITLKTRENLIGARVIRAFTQENDEKKRFVKENNLLLRLQTIVGKISALMNPLTFAVINASIIALIYVGGVRVNIGKLSNGEVVALYSYMSQILVELIKLANLIVTTTKALACAERIENVLNIKNSTCHNENLEITNDYAVYFDNVSLVYKNARNESLSNINFSANKGEIIGIIGGTGSGKTSLVSLIPHFYDCTSGTVYVNGIDVKAQNEDELRSKIGFVFQKSALFKGTVKENLKWGNENASDEDILTALSQAQILDTINEKGGLSAKIEQNGANLSGGQKQRITIARALVRKPEILIFDDSFSALDFETEAKIRSIIQNLDYKPTVFIVSQRTSSIMQANKIIVLDDGKCVGLGSHNDLLLSSKVYKEIYDSQFNGEDSL